MTPSNSLRDQAAGLMENHPCRGLKAEHLAEVLAAATLRRLSDGDALCVEGEPGDAMFFLIDGAIRVQRRDARGTMRELAVMTPPTLVGHMSLVDNSPRSASCIARGRTVVAALDRRTYSQILTEPSARGMALRRLLLSSLTTQLATANERIADLIDGPDPAKTAAKPASKNKSADRYEPEEFGDVSNTDLLKLAGVLDGWKIDSRGMNSMKVTYTEDQKRHPKNRNIK
jgi:CRP-like cAMP-binding protein